MEVKKPCHSALYWKKRIEEMIIQYNLLSSKKMNFSIIEERIGNDLNRAIKEYVKTQNIYIKFIKENYIEPKNEVNNCNKKMKKNIQKNHQVTEM